MSAFVVVCVFCVRVVCHFSLLLITVFYELAVCGFPAFAVFLYVLRMVCI